MSGAQVGSDAQGANSATAQLVCDLWPQRRDQAVEFRVQEHGVAPRDCAEPSVDLSQGRELEGVFVGFSGGRADAPAGRRQRERGERRQRKRAPAAGRTAPADPIAQRLARAAEPLVQAGEHEQCPQGDEPREHPYRRRGPQRVAERFGEERRRGGGGVGDREDCPTQGERERRPGDEVHAAAA